MKNKLLVGIFMLFGTLFAAIAQMLWKYGAENNYLLIIIFGYLIYGIFFILMTLAFKYSQMSFVYPFIALSFLWVALFARIFFGEEISIMRIMGLLSIILGIIFVGGSK